ncbi:flagellar hook-length control protein FliK [Helicobacter sp. 23-1044]
MVETISKETQNSIATKRAKSPQGRAFADFIKDLGKTTAPTKADFKNANLSDAKKADSAPKITQNLADSAVDLKADSAKNVAQNAKDSAKKSEILSDILKSKNEEKPQSTPKSPLDEILSRPKAINAKLNQTPQIKDSTKDFSPKMSPNVGNNVGKNVEKNVEKNVADSAKNVAQNAKDSAKIAESSAKIAESNVKITHPLAPSAREGEQIGKSSIKNGENLSESSAKNGENLSEFSAQKKSNLLSDLPKNGALDSAKNKIETTQDSAKNAESKNSTHPLTPSAREGGFLNEFSAKNGALDSAKNEMQNVEKNLMQNAENLAHLNDDFTKDSALINPKIEAQNNGNLGIKNTLKYGAFKAFDALSLLTPSDGKKLSDLIKKADELSLNLQSIKYTKMGEKNSIFENIKAPKIDEKINADSAKSAESNAKITESKNSTHPLAPSAREGEKFDSTSAREGEKFDSTSAKNGGSLSESSAKNGENLEKSSTPNKIAESSQKNIAESSQNKIAESASKNLAESSQNKLAESPLKNALDSAENKENDIKQIALKNEKFAESKKETALDSAKDSAKDSPKDSAKNTQEISIISNAESTSKIEHKIFDAKEVMKNFANNLKQEIQNYKPPISKITIELQPANLGSVEVSIISQGKNIQIQLHSNQQTLNLFIQNQSDLRSALAQIGYENVAMSFSNGAQMGFSDNSGKWRYEQKYRNDFRLKQSDENDEKFEIMIINNYA